MIITVRQIPYYRYHGEDKKGKKERKMARSHCMWMGPGQVQGMGLAR